MNPESSHTSADLVAPIVDALRAHVPAARCNDAQTFATRLFARVAPGDLARRDAATWAAMALDLMAFVASRDSGKPKVRVFNPQAASHGWSSPHTVVQVVTEDMPFLVDSTSMALGGAGGGIHTVIHPVLKLKRSAAGEVAVLDGGAAATAESVMHFEVDHLDDEAERNALAQRIESVLEDVRAAVNGWEATRGRMLAIADELPGRVSPINAAGLAEAQAFLRWVADDHFIFLGYREYDVVAVGGDEVLKAREDTGLGILSGQERSQAPRSLKTLVATHLPQSGATDAIILTKTNARATVHRAGYMDYIGVLKFDANGKAVAEQRFLGLFTSGAYMCRPQEVPLLRQKVDAVMQRSELKRDSYSGKSLRHILEVLPRDELFQSSVEELFGTAMGILDLKERARTRLFVRTDRYGRFYSCLAFVPRERFNTSVRERTEAMLREAFHGERLDSTVLMGESALARLHVTVRPGVGERAQVQATDLESRLVSIVRNWQDELRDQLAQTLGEAAGTALASRYLRALPAGYMEDVSPALAAEDLRALDTLAGDDGIRMGLYRDPRDNGLRFKVMHSGAPIPLSEALPMLENMGVRMLAEHVYSIERSDTTLTIHDFELDTTSVLAFDLGDLRAHFTRAFEALWRGDAENDGFNRLVLGALLDWRQVAMLRGYNKYLQQCGMTFSQSYIEESLNRYPAIANLLVELFNAKFDPRRTSMPTDERERAAAQLRHELSALVPAKTQERLPSLIDTAVAALALPREEQIHTYWSAIKLLLDDVASLDDERIIKSYMEVIRATLRTSFFQTWDGAPRHYISFKLDSHQVPDLPKPVPYREIWVYGPRVEGVHLRFGPVARGGLRWSDRREDFRTEVLGLVKAQMVKNTVIVPVGSKGGFFVKRPPAGGDRDAYQAEGVACYKMFIHGLLDITDNLLNETVVPPDNVVRHDDDDPYLVVAADKGTARFSDTANAISAEHHYWLDDAFASGGSHGYDHKGMGITARGGWESVKRHFRALGRDCQSQDFTCVGIGDMSGDVFGNGMLLSRHTRVLAAFDHRHIFLDPNPDAERSFVERERMFNLPRSSWEDYDTSLISAGGGVWARSLKAIPLAPEVRQVLGLKAEVESLSPNDLMNAILKAPVDLLWNGGIGTYVKAATETHADVGDRANNGLRVNGGELRCKIVGEGGNLGFTQKGRIEASESGVLLNTDFIDNSAGVDTSDHEVNIKILLGDAVQRGELTMDARNTQLAAMTDEVAELVLRDNYRQNQAITLMEHMAVKRLGSMGHFIRVLESEGRLDRQVESLPSDAELTERKAHGKGLTRPELAILLSYDKIKLFQQLLDSDVPEDPFLSKELVRYFPEPLHGTYAEHMQRHKLKREIIATAVTNSTVNRMGATFMLRMQEDTGQGPAAIAKAYTAAREIIDARGLWSGIEALDGTLADATQIDAMLQVWSLLRHLTRWLLTRPGGSLEIAANVERYASGVTQLRQALPAALTVTGQADFDINAEKWQGLGFGEELALRMARVPVLRAALDMVEAAHASGQPIARVAGVFFGMAEALDLDWLRSEIEALPVESRWHAQARGSLLDELSHQHRALAVQVLSWNQALPADQAVAAWLERDDPALQYTRSMLSEILTQTADYPIASVAVRRLALLAQAG
ncbi:MAG TPA: NAD-glutamate dehydrogenase domain-containing protein [Rhodanobacteraceae bacterium]|nr:NAD-glutamate dehydrogenase domain-containing protein [Rhodanobacteraceae bacterium]